MIELVLANSFLGSLADLDAGDLSRVVKFLQKIRANPENPGINFERVMGARDNRIFSARVTQGLRAILHRDGNRSTLLYAGQHDDAYDWAARRTVAPHPVTGVIQIVETTEEVERTLPPVPQDASVVTLFPASRFDDAYLLSLGVPQEWIPTVRRVENEDHLLAVLERLPEEVAERLFALANGEFVTPPKPAAPALAHADTEWQLSVLAERRRGEAVSALMANPDNLRRFFVVQSDADLADVLNQPLEAWIRFLHPSQRALADGSFAGPFKVTGSAGTGKTVVALHRARGLARKGKHVLVTTFATALCRNLERNLGVLCRPEDLARIKVTTVHKQAFAIARTGRPQIRAVNDDEVLRLVERSCERTGLDVDLAFLRGEWANVIDRQGLMSWEAYRDADRRGRGRPLNARERQRLWDVFGAVWGELELANRTTWDGLCRLAADQLERGVVPSPFDAVVVDEVQDLGAADLRLVAALGGKGRDGLLLVGDAGQRIYPGGFSLRALGIDVRGRSRVLRINYRTTEQIQRAADRVLGDVCDDLDDGSESRRGTVSLLRGPEPEFRGLTGAADERAFVVDSVRRLTAEGLAPSEIGLFGRTHRLAESFAEALRAAKYPIRLLRDLGDEDDDPKEAGISIGTMHSAKGLEFKVVFAVGCDDRMLPNAFVLEKIEDAGERQAAIDQERRLLYVSMTRARDEAFVTWSGTPSPFVSELLAGKGAA